MGLHLEPKKISLELDATELTQKQIRLIKSLISMLTHVLTTEDESELFEGSAEFMRMSAALIKQSRFTEDFAAGDKIPYSEQVIEYSIDMLQDYISGKKVIHYDN